MAESLEATVSASVVPKGWCTEVLGRLGEVEVQAVSVLLDEHAAGRRHDDRLPGLHVAPRLTVKTWPSLWTLRRMFCALPFTATCTGRSLGKSSAVSAT